MGRLIGIDYGMKRVGIALTDPMQIFASPHETVPADKIYQYLEIVVPEKEIEGIVLGWPVNLQGGATDSSDAVEKFEAWLRGKFPSVPVFRQDERFTSKMAVKTMVEGGMKKKDRQNKANIDKISASIILQSYLESKTL